MFEDIFSIREAAEILGYSVDHVRKLVHQKRISHMRISSRIYFKVADLKEFRDRLIASGKVVQAVQQ